MKKVIMSYKSANFEGVFGRQRAKTREKPILKGYSAYKGAKFCTKSPKSQ